MKFLLKWCPPMLGFAAFGCFSMAVWSADMGLGWQWFVQGSLLFLLGIIVNLGNL